ncbi:hypothetical protein BZL41_17070 [Pseudomonas sp. PIC25]|uniref:hypothetical protein n=1 Tax=Pseudomonas sp. PIC25 TaxID=1958773 RepID=UPI000BAB6388|nr:hypothetical protein [Pseudomonas sp. PIC25]PAU59024.1 hypothetical protein BZL41_17070 [Pseudomonas sp. PIC25]
MKYSTGEEIKLGDIVQVGGNDIGAVVGIIETGEFSKDYPAEDWAYLNTGTLILTQEAGLIHYPEPDDEIKLIERKI